MKAYVSLGSNLDDRRRHVEEGVRRLGTESGVRVRGVSRIYETAPEGPVREQPRFLNAVAEIETDLGPEALLDRLLRIEAAEGRERRVRQGPRTLDLDLLIYGDRVLRSDRLQVPHPRMCERRFVLEPLAELAPELVIPGDGRTVRQALEGVSGRVS